MSETNRIEYKRELTSDLDNEKEVSFHFTDNFIRITFPASVQTDHASGLDSTRKIEKWPEKWPENGQKILEVISYNKSVTIAQLEEELNIGHTTLKKILREMQNENIIRRVGPAKGGHWEVVER